MPFWIVHFTNETGNGMLALCVPLKYLLILPSHTAKLRVYRPKLASWIVLPRSCMSEDCNLNNYSAWVFERGIISWFLFLYEWWLVIPPTLLALSLITWYLMVCAFPCCHLCELHHSLMDTLFVSGMKGFWCNHWVCDTCATKWHSSQSLSIQISLSLCLTM